MNRDERPTQDLTEQMRAYRNDTTLLLGEPPAEPTVEYSPLTPPFEMPSLDQPEQTTQFIADSYQAPEPTTQFIADPYQAPTPAPAPRGGFKLPWKALGLAGFVVGVGLLTLIGRSWVERPAASPAIEPAVMSETREGQQEVVLAEQAAGGLTTVATVELGQAAPLPSAPIAPLAEPVATEVVQVVEAATQTPAVRLDGEPPLADTSTQTAPAVAAPMNPPSEPIVVANSEPTAVVAPSASASQGQPTESAQTESTPQVAETTTSGTEQHTTAQDDGARAKQATTTQAQAEQVRQRDREPQTQQVAQQVVQQAAARMPNQVNQVIAAQSGQPAAQAVTSQLKGIFKR